MKIFFLYTELADYTIKCFHKHLSRRPEDEIHVFHYPVNPEAPFEFEMHDRLHMYNIAELSRVDAFELLHRKEPNVILCSSWRNRLYMQMVWKCRKTCITVLILDNIYKGTLKQLMFLGPARLVLPKFFQNVWVPGRTQQLYARLLGFDQEKIDLGFYATDTAKLEEIFYKWKADQNLPAPKVFLCVARYIPEKGLEVLWEAFTQLYNEGYKDWELWNAGTGEFFNERMEHKAIKHLGFVQPKNFANLIQNAGVFVLPSFSEPWGVAVNEFAAAGMPLVLSDKVGSAERFLLDGKNGFRFAAGDISDLKEKLKKIMELDDAELFQMGQISHQLGTATNALNWSITLDSIKGQSK